MVLLWVNTCMVARVLYTYNAFCGNLKNEVHTRPVVCTKQIIKHTYKVD